MIDMRVFIRNTSQVFYCNRNEWVKDKKLQVANSVEIRE